MKIAAYCRVSTDKADQLNSLEAQKEIVSLFSPSLEHWLRKKVRIRLSE